MLTLFHNRQQQTRDNNNNINKQQGTKWFLCVFPAEACDTNMELGRTEKEADGADYVEAGGISLVRQVCVVKQDAVQL